MLVYARMAIRRGEIPLLGLIKNRAQRPDAMMRLDTMTSMVRYLDRSGGTGIGNSPALLTAIGDQATGILRAPRGQRRRVGEVLTRLLESGDEKKIALGKTLSAELRKAKNAMRR